MRRPRGRDGLIPRRGPARPTGARWRGASRAGPSEAGGAGEESSGPGAGAGSAPAPWGRCGTAPAREKPAGTDWSGTGARPGRGPGRAPGSVPPGLGPAVREEDRRRYAPWRRLPGEATAAIFSGTLIPLRAGARGKPGVVRLGAVATRTGHWQGPTRSSATPAPCRRWSASRSASRRPRTRSWSAPAGSWRRGTPWAPGSRR